MALVVPHVHLVPGTMAGNIYLLEGDALTLVDTGMPGGADRILDYVREMGHRPEDLTRIVLTHYHVDHVGSAAALKARTGATVLAHPDDAPFIDGTAKQPPPRHGLLRVLHRFLPVMSRFEPVTPDELGEDGSYLEILDGARIVHMPGHTPGAIALHLAGLGVLISGDAIDNRKGAPGPPPAPFTVDSTQAIASIRKVAQLDFEVLCPGHGPSIVGGASAQVRAMAAGLG
jgi:glyoxylase-like metal-dependent hydrolase (beta-lactamase superfamily II)